MVGWSGKNRSRRQQDAQFSPDGTVLLPALPGAAVRQAQDLLAAWASL